MGEESICEAEIPFGIVKINRVDLLRHRRRTHFAFDDRLFQISITDVAPDVLRKVNEDGIGQAHRIKITNPIIVGKDLSREQIRLKTKTRDKALAEGQPVHLRKSSAQGIEVADCPR